MTKIEARRLLRRAKLWYATRPNNAARRSTKTLPELAALLGLPLEADREAAAAAINLLLPAAIEQARSALSATERRREAARANGAKNLVSKGRRPLSAPRCPVCGKTPSRHWKRRFCGEK